MTQHDMSCANDTGANFRADGNLALQALVSRSSGPSAPSTTYPYQIWEDTTNNVTQQRNGANTAWNMMPQSAFLVTNSVLDDNVTGNGVQFTVDFDQEIFDQGADFAADTFTAPIDGRYLLITQVTLVSLTPTNTDARLQIVTSNRAYPVDFNPGNLEAKGALGNATVTFSVVADMDENDTAHVTIKVYQATQIIDVYGGQNFTNFSGCLLA